MALMTKDDRLVVALGTDALNYRELFKAAVTALYEERQARLTLEARYERLLEDFRRVRNGRGGNP
jgi:hypothetical protein